MQETYFVIKQNGSIFRRDINEHEVQLSAQAVASMSAQTPVRLPAAATIDTQIGQLTCDLVAVAGAFHWSVRLPILPICCPVTAQTNGSTGPVHVPVLVPQFDSKERSYQLTWIPPESLRLFFVGVTHLDGRTVTAGLAYLFAFDSARNAYRLPLPNLHDDAMVCVGHDNHGRAPTHLAAFTQLLGNFLKTTWNADLWQDRARSHAMFRWQARDDQFLTLPPASEWTALSDKISTLFQHYAFV